MMTAEDLIKGFVESSVEMQDEWLRKNMMESNGLLTVPVSSVMPLRKGVILTPYSSRSNPELRSRILFEDRDNPIVRSHAVSRAMQVVDDADFAHWYSLASAGFRHYTDATVIKLCHSLWQRTAKMDGQVLIDASNVVGALCSLITVDVKPDHRRSVHAIKIAGIMTNGKVSVGDVLFIKAHSDVGQYGNFASHLKTISKSGYAWRSKVEKDYESWKTCGLSALGRQEIELRFKLPDDVSFIEQRNLINRILIPLDSLLVEEAVKFGMETNDMRRDIRKIILAVTSDVAFKMEDNYDALVSSVWPRQSLTFIVNLK